MAKLVLQIFFLVGTYASLLSLILTLRPAEHAPSTIQTILFLLASAIFLSAVVYEIQDFVRHGPRLFTEQRKINAFMFKWISRAGRVAIFSRDLSWVQAHPRIQQLLSEKARRDELCICLPRRIPLTDDLEREGAQICTYPELDYTPESRFTIVNRGRTGARVAVGRAVGDKHRIDKFSHGEHPAFSVTNDLIEILTRLNRLRSAPR